MHNHIVLHGVRLLEGLEQAGVWLFLMTRKHLGELIPRQPVVGRPWTCMVVWGFYIMQACGPKVATGQGPCREWVLLSSSVLPRAGEAGELSLAGLEGVAEPSALVCAQLLFVLTFSVPFPQSVNEGLDQKITMLYTAAGVFRAISSSCPWALLPPPVTSLPLALWPRCWTPLSSSHSAILQHNLKIFLTYIQPIFKRQTLFRQVRQEVSFENKFEQSQLVFGFSSMENVCFSDPFSVLLAKRCLKTKYFSKVAYFEMLRLR